MPVLQNCGRFCEALSVCSSLRLDVAETDQGDRVSMADFLSSNERELFLDTPMEQVQELGLGRRSKSEDLAQRV